MAATIQPLAVAAARAGLTQALDHLPTITLTQASIVSLLTFGLGLIIGHRLTLRRDRRKEFNDAARPIRDWLLEAAKHPSPYLSSPSVSQLDAFTSRLSRRKQTRFNSGVQAYRDAIRTTSRQDSAGQLELHDIITPGNIAKQLLTYTKIK